MFSGLQDGAPHGASGSPSGPPVRPVEHQGNDLGLPVGLTVGQSQSKDFPSFLFGWCWCPDQMQLFAAGWSASFFILLPSLNRPLNFVPTLPSHNFIHVEIDFFFFCILSSLGDRVPVFEAQFRYDSLCLLGQKWLNLSAKPQFLQLHNRGLKKNHTYLLQCFSIALLWYTWYTKNWTYCNVYNWICLDVRKHRWSEVVLRIKWGISSWP